MWSRARSSESTTWRQSSKETEAAEVQKREEGEGGGLDLSLEQFPLLLSLKKTDAAADTLSNQSEVISRQAGELGICFGSFRPSTGQSSSVAAEKVGSCLLTMETSMSGSPLGKGKEPKSLESNDKRYVGRCWLKAVLGCQRLRKDFGFAIFFFLNNKENKEIQYVDFYIRDNIGF